MTRPRLFTPFDWIMAIGTLILIALIIWFCFILGRPAGAVTANLTSPAANAVLGASADFSGTGQPGSQLRLFFQDRELTTSPITVGADGNWSLPTANIAALGLNPGTYNLDLRSVDNAGAVLASRSFPFRIEAAAAPSDISIATPTNDSELPAGSFELSGAGVAGETLEIFQEEPGGEIRSLGTVLVGPDGKWTTRSPSVGDQGGSYSYRTRSTSGPSREAQTRVRFAAATGAATACTKDYFLSLADGQTLTQPFRFGGDGKGQGYTVTVKRGERIIGSRPLPLDRSCAFGYNSRPGPGIVTYEVRQGVPPNVDLSAAPLSSVTITIR
jgi:hypothetical protein